MFKSHIIKSRIIISIIGILLILNFIIVLFLHLKNPVRTLNVFHKLRSLQKKFLGNNRIKKFSRVGGKYFWMMGAPHWPSRTLNDYLIIESRKILGKSDRFTGLRTLFLAVTRKCPYTCEHCFEWDHLNGREVLSVENLMRIISYFQDRGVAQVQLTGGEPMMRYNDLIELLNSARKGTDFWLLTSGYQLTQKRAVELKSAGLTGVSISLDHHIPEVHDRFRGFTGAFDWVIEAVKNSHDARLAVCLSLCVTRDYVSQDNLFHYASLSRSLGVSFIQILEPMPVGHFAGKDVQLSDDQLEILDHFYLEMNFGSKYRSWPIVAFPGYHQRKIGCFGSGNRYLYINSIGELNACPFCHKNYGDIRNHSFEHAIQNMMSDGCQIFSPA